MKLPNADQAVVEESKVVEYLLNVNHRRGASKAKALLSLGYNPGSSHLFINDIKQQHLSGDVVEVRKSPWGERCDIVAPLTGPSGDTMMFRSIWQIDLGSDRPRLITMYPE